MPYIRPKADRRDRNDRRTGILFLQPGVCGAISERAPHLAGRQPLYELIVQKMKIWRFVARSWLATGVGVVGQFLVFVKLKSDLTLIGREIEEW